MSRMLTPHLLALGGLAALLLPSTALAWRHLDPPRAWLPEDMPIRYSVADDGAENSIEACAASAPGEDIDPVTGEYVTSGGMSGCCEETVPAGYCIQAAAEGFEAWHAAECAEFDVEYLEEVAPNIGFQWNGLNYIAFNDPDGDLPEPGTLAATVVQSQGDAFILDGVVYAHAVDMDIVFNEDVEFDTNESIAAGTCKGTNMRSVMTHEIGHGLGMGHSCEEGESCTDPLLRDATMNWSEDACQTHNVEINQDDIEGFTALYGPYASFSCSHEVDEDQVVGVVPFDLNCVIVSDYYAEITGATWSFGDGGSSDSLTPTHRYETPGNYTIQVTVNGERAACGEDGWENSFRKVGYVRACGVPEPVFTFEHVDGLKYQMLNESDVSVYGCIQDIQWEIYEGEGISGQPIGDAVKAWEPILEFPDDGTYTVVMNLGGIAGTGAAQLVVDAKNRRGEGYGCQTAGGLGGAAGLLAVVALAGVRRRRD